MKKTIRIKQIVLALMLIATLALVSCGFRGCKAQCDHKWDLGVLINATECGDGAQAMFTCKLCGETKKDNANTHNYVIKNTIAPTCTAMGYSEFECSRCKSNDYVVANFVNALGHKYDTDIVVKEATCTTNGTHEKACTNCGNTQVYAQSATGHTYVLISEESTHSTYQCEHCFELLTINRSEEIKDFTLKEELFDIDPSFSFDIISSQDENFIRQNLKILNNYYNNSEHEDSVLENYALNYKGSNTWTVSLPNGYDYATTYIAKPQGDITFANYKCKNLVFTTIQDPNHVNTYKYTDGIVFLQAMENANPGYYPYAVFSSPESEYLYVNVHKIDGLVKDMLLCVGDATCKEELNFGKEIYFGKIYDFYPLPDGSFMMLLSKPDVAEIYDELDIYSSGDIDFDNAKIDSEQLEAELISSLYESDDFIKFLSVVNVSANEYYTQHGYYAEELSDIKSFMDNIELDHKYTTSGNSLTAWVKGTLSIPIKNSNRIQIGSFNVSFYVELSTEISYTASFELENLQFDLKITQTDNFNFNFNVSIDIDYSLDERPYIQNTETGKIHRSGCVHLSSIKDTSILKGLSVETAEKYIKGNPNLGCKHCQPIVGFKSELVVLNTNSKVIHAYGCATLTNISDSNKKLSKEKAGYWIEQGYSCCDLCHPDAREETNYKAIYVQKLYCSDWEDVATDIRQWAKDSGATGHNQAGINFTTINLSLGGSPVFLSFDFNLVLTLDIKASFNYEYAYEHTNIYGFRTVWLDVDKYFIDVSSETTKNHCSVAGEAELRVGLLVDVNINILGCQAFAAGITAELGVYARLAGILEWDQISNENYVAAFFEAGIYVDINAYYNFVEWDGTLNIYDDKWAFLTLGYERAYFAYETYHDTLVINGYLDIDEANILKVKYFDLKTMDTSIDELSMFESSKYDVNIYFENGQYCDIVNGIVIAKDGAPSQFEDTMIITVSCDSKWSSLEKENYVYYLGYYEIDIIFNVKNNGLAYQLNSDGVSYSVVGIGTCTDTNLVIPNNYKGFPVTAIANSAFWGCTFESVNIPNSVITIGDDAFRDCIRLANVNIPNSVKHIGYGTFRGCISLESIVIPDSVLTLNSSVFMDCTTLTDVVVGNSVTAIPASCFRYCLSLRNVTIGSSVTWISHSSFEYCMSLTNINYNGKLSQWKSIDKGNNWNYNTGKYTIRCKDGVYDSTGPDGPRPVVGSWSVIGTMEGTVWNVDFELVEISSGKYRSAPLYFNANGEFKCRMDGSWDLNFGKNGDINGENCLINSAGYYIIEFIWDGMSRRPTINVIPCDSNGNY